MTKDLPQVIALIYECFLHFHNKRRGPLYRLFYRRRYMKDYREAAELLIDALVSVKKGSDLYRADIVEQHTHHAHKSVMINDPETGKLYSVTVGLDMVVSEISPISLRMEGNEDAVTPDGKKVYQGP